MGSEGQRPPGRPGATVDLALTPVSGLWIAYAAAAAALVFLVLRARPVTLGNAALVALLLQQVWNSIASVLRVGAADADVAWSATLANIPAWLLWAPLVFLAGPLLLGNGPGAKRARVLGIAGALPGLVLLAVFPFARDAVIKPDLSGLTDAAVAVLFLTFVGFGFTVAVLAREALTTPLPVRRGQFALLAAAFSVEGAYHAAQNSAKLLLGLEFHGQEGAAPWLSALSIAPLVVFGAVAAWALGIALRSQDPMQRRWARILAAFIGASALTGVLASPLRAVDEFTDPLASLHALWDLAGLALIVYAGLRYQLFSLERRAKQSVAVTAAIAMGFVAWNATQELAEGALADVDVFQGIPASGIVAALLVGAVSVPIGKAGQNFARKLFPHVVPTQDYEHQRRLQIYLAALEGALADGVATPRELASLRRLRAELAIQEDEHDRLEGEIRQRLAAAPPAGAAA